MSETLDRIRERTKAWLAPVPGASPAGAPARLDPAYQAIANEVAKLEAPSGGEVDWKQVVSGAGDLLRTKSKDLVLAAFLANGLHATGGLDGLATGLGLVSDLLDQFWETAFPELKRLKGRLNAVQWLVERSQLGLAGREAGVQDLEAARGLDEVANRFAEVVRARFADAAPSLGGLLQEAGRLRAAAEAAQPPPAPPAPEPGAATGPGAGAPAAPGATLPGLPAGGPGPGEGSVDYLRNVGGALIAAAHAMRGADATDSLPYRVLRVGLWLHLQGPPPASGGKTTVPPPPEPLRAQLELLAANQKWAALLEEAESALPQNRFWLDLHRHASQALGALGGAHARAREAVVGEVRALLGRMPQLPSLSFGDGSPFAGAQTKGWLEEEVAPRASAGGGAQEEDASLAERIAAAKRALAEGQLAEGLGGFQALIDGRTGGRARFRARLELAKACAGAGLLAVAKATYDELDREAVAHELDSWEPVLSAECLKGLISTARALAKDPRGASESLTPQYRRLARIDPAAAHEVWP